MGKKKTAIQNYYTGWIIAGFEGYLLKHVELGRWTVCAGRVFWWKALCWFWCQDKETKKSVPASRKQERWEVKRFTRGRIFSGDWLESAWGDADGEVAVKTLMRELMFVDEDHPDNHNTRKHCKILLANHSKNNHRFGPSGEKTWGAHVWGKKKTPETKDTCNLKSLSFDLETLNRFEFSQIYRFWQKAYGFFSVPKMTHL